MTAAPECIDCAFGDRDHPCRTDGRLDVASVASAYLANNCTPEDGHRDSELDWSFSCIWSLGLQHPEITLDVVIECLRQATTIDEVGMIAAGPLEQVISMHGQQVIERIEMLAQSSSRFRFALSGVWSQGQDESEVWRRVLGARAPDHELDRAAALPAADL
ncbi:MAG: DUF6869 domain-containing protein [Gemmobacter sp.]